MSDTTEQRDTATIAGKFAEALGCLEDAGDYLERINKEYTERFPDGECEMPEHMFWWRIEDAIEPLERILKGLEAVARHVPKEVAA